MSSFSFVPFRPPPVALSRPVNNAQSFRQLHSVASSAALCRFVSCTLSLRQLRLVSPSVALSCFVSCVQLLRQLHSIASAAAALCRPVSCAQSLRQLRSVASSAAFSRFVSCALSLCPARIDTIRFNRRRRCVGTCAVSASCDRTHAMLLYIMTSRLVFETSKLHEM